ncbi:FDLD family class I lanthipeptide [Streptomyces sp. NPDC004232]|uniref:FDLD family class I lanthipeptide n=1 Tax=unclassified Streptomyces TaxID=2593676 RepID=UPI001DD503C5|nr:FDLD family class I lanthipeptide [Streptomyces sp. tea 10]
MSVAMPAESPAELSEFDLDVRVELDESASIEGALSVTPTATIVFCPSEIGCLTPTCS